MPKKLSILALLGLCAILVVLNPAFIQASVIFPRDLSPNSRTEFLMLALEATDWMMQFQITPSACSWGWHTPSSEAWGGLAGYYTRNYLWAAIYGAESPNITYIASHDTGWFMQCCVKAYTHTRDSKYLAAAQLAADWAMRLQIGYSNWPATFESNYVALAKQNRSVTYSFTKSKIPSDAVGSFAEGMFFFSGVPPGFGQWGGKANFAQPAWWIAPEHSNPLINGLLDLYEITGNQTYKTAAIRASSWLLTIQNEQGGVYTCLPSTAYGVRLGDTLESISTWIRIYQLTGNQTYLKAATKAGDFVLSSQYRNKTEETYGGFPYLSKTLGERHIKSAFTGDAAGAIVALLQLYQCTRNASYLCGCNGIDEQPTSGAIIAAEFLLRSQLTPFYYSWGKHWYWNQRKAMGGILFGFIPEDQRYSEWQMGGAATAAVEALLRLDKIQPRHEYIKAAGLILRWLIDTEMHTPSCEVNSLPGLSYIGTKHGLYKAGYLPPAQEYYDALEGTLYGHPSQGFSVAMSCAGPALVYYYIYEYLSGDTSKS